MKLAALAFLGALAATASAGPVRVTVECEQYGRTKACPAFLLGFIDANKAMLQSPRSDADVVVYASANEVALVDRMHLRFVGAIQGAPPVIELDVDVDTRGTDDEQRAQLEPAFLRGMALYVAARYPDSVKVVIEPPEETATATPSTTPWGLSISFGGSGNRTERFKSASGYGEIETTYTTRRVRMVSALNASYGLNFQPPLVLEDGTEVSLDTRQWSFGGGAGAGYLMNDCWSAGAVARAMREDPKGQHHYLVQSFAGIEWDKYAADDPRGNRLAVLYKAGAHVERYNIRNKLGERFAAYPYHALIASGSLRKDKVTVGLSLSAQAEMFDPERRHSLSASPYVEVQLGAHVDLSASFSITKRELPGPDESQIDPSDFALLSRLSYAEPLAINGSLNLTIHWDRTNGARNDRLEDL
ncbi:MAG: hypothetical protein JNL83_19655 [Myxococcales bacterium]|nr:hypothetical protein [Myxococcales bacterium]